MNPDKKTILLVDDDPDFLLQEKLLLERAGYLVVTAESCKGAEERLQEMEPDAAVVDLMLEHADGGFTLCRQIKARNPTIPVVMVTAVTSETGLRFGTTTESERSWIKADAVLAKPIRFEQIKRELHRWLGE